jgi:hypothetical protein
VTYRPLALIICSIWLFLCCQFQKESWVRHLHFSVVKENYGVWVLLEWYSSQVFRHSWIWPWTTAVLPSWMSLDTGTEDKGCEPLIVGLSPCRRQSPWYSGIENMQQSSTDLPQQTQDLQLFLDWLATHKVRGSMEGEDQSVLGREEWKAK